MDIKCPITREIMYDPVVASDGVVYERDAIEKWLSMNSHSPVTKESLKKDIYDCSILKRYIDQYIKDNPKKKKKQYEPSFDYNDNKDQINKFISSNQFNKLLNYKNYDIKNMCLYINHMVSNCSQLDIINYVIRNCINIKEYLDGSAYNLLQRLCKKDNLDMIKYFVEEVGMNIESTQNSSKKDNLIHIACREEATNIISYLISKGVNLESENNEKVRPIHIACSKKNINIVKQLIDHGVNLDCKNNDDVRPIDYACENNNMDIIKILIEYKVDLSDKDIYDNTILHRIVKNSSLATVEYIIEMGLDTQLEMVNMDGDRPIHIACQYNKNNDVIKYLASKTDLEATNKKGYTPLHCLCRSNNVDMVKYFCELNVNTSCTDIGGNTPIHFACSKGSFAIIRCLVDSATLKGVNINTVNNIGRHSFDDLFNSDISQAELKYLLDQGVVLSSKALYAAINASRKRPLEYIQFIVENIKDKIDFEYDEKLSIWPTLFLSWSTDIIKYVISIKIKQDGVAPDFNKISRDKAAVDYALLRKNKDLLRFLLDFNVSLTGPIIETIVAYNWYDILLYAHEKGYDLTPYTEIINANIPAKVSEGDVSILQIIKQIDPDICDRAFGSRTLIQLACEHNKFEMVKYLIENGADPNKPNPHGSQAIHFACQKSSVQIIDYLLSNPLNKENWIDLECGGEDAKKPIVWVCRYNTVDTIKFLIDKNVKLDDVLTTNGTILMDLLKKNERLNDSQRKEIFRYCKEKMT